MAFEQRDNSGSLFINDRKEKANQPDRTGRAMIGGKMYWVSGWVKETRDGAKFLSMAFTLDEKANNKPPAQKNGGGFDDMDDDIPF